MATFFNQATISYNGNVTNSNITTGEILEALYAVKTPVDDEYWFNEENTYVISITNSGTTSYTNLTLTDDLGEYPFGTGILVPLTYVENSVLYYVNGVLQPAPAVTAGDGLTISGVNVPAGGNAIILYAVTANKYAPLDVNSSITNTVTISGCSMSVTAEATVTARNDVMLSVAKSLSPATVVGNERITYTITVQNYGNTPVVATDDAIITDNFDPVLSNLAVSFNGTQWTEGVNYTYNAVTGTFSTNPAQITVPSAEYSQNTSGEWVIQPGVSTLVISGNINA